MLPRCNLVAGSAAALATTITRLVNGKASWWEHGWAVGVRSNTIGNNRGFRNGLGWGLGLWRRNDRAGLSIRTLKGVFPALDTLARKSRKPRLLRTNSTTVTVIVESSCIAVDLVLAVGPHLGISRKAGTPGLDALHVGSSAILVGCAKSWIISISGTNNSRWWWLTGGYSVSNQTILTLAFEPSDRVLAGSILMAGKLVFFTFQSV